MSDYTDRLADLIRENAADLAAAIEQRGPGSIDAIRVLHEIQVAAQTDERLERRALEIARAARTHRPIRTH